MVSFATSNPSAIQQDVHFLNYCPITCVSTFWMTTTNHCGTESGRSRSTLSSKYAKKKSRWRLWKWVPTLSDDHELSVVTYRMRSLRLSWLSSAGLARCSFKLLHNGKQRGSYSVPFLWLLQVKSSAEGDREPEQLGAMSNYWVVCFRWYMTSLT